MKTRGAWVRQFASTEVHHARVPSLPTSPQSPATLDILPMSYVLIHSWLVFFFHGHYWLYFWLGFFGFKFFFLEAAFEWMAISTALECFNKEFLPQSLTQKETGDPFDFAYHGEICDQREPGVDMFESKLWFACRCQKDSRMNPHKIEWLGLLSWRSLSIVSKHSQLPRWRHFGDIYSCPCCGRSLRAVTHHLSAERNERNDSQVGSLVPFLHRSHMRCVGNEGMEDLSCSSWLIQHKSTSVLVHTRVCYWGFEDRWMKSVD